MAAALTFANPRWEIFCPHRGIQWSNSSGGHHRDPRPQSASRRWGDPCVVGDLPGSELRRGSHRRTSRREWMRRGDHRRAVEGTCGSVSARASEEKRGRGGDWSGDQLTRVIPASPALLHARNSCTSAYTFPQQQARLHKNGQLGLSTQGRPNTALRIVLCDNAETLRKPNSLFFISTDVPCGPKGGKATKHAP
jgi:hypothetical protein